VNGRERLVAAIRMICPTPRLANRTFLTKGLELLGRTALPIMPAWYGPFVHIDSEGVSRPRLLKRRSSA
jgi:hypothetical protein